ncbi:hypothetical protein EKL94_00010 [Stenotrophomonas maltophilia]|uniref:Uncharacterized protein n=1 Tax=Stenotrophomonas maltophilia TaxID=40324 RepID=A0A431US61_STEMA|nr:hypothetical protein EKL94_00010 [Stenotrophomonas maltophilia]
MNLHRNRIFRIEIEKHPRMAWIYCRSQKSVEGGVGPVAGVSAAWMPRPSPQGEVTPGSWTPDPTPRDT